MEDRLSLTTEALFKRRLKSDDLLIEQDGFMLYYHLETIHAYEKQEIVKIIQRILSNDRPPLILKCMAEASGLANLQIADQRIKPVKHASTTTRPTPELQQQTTLKTPTTGT